MLRVTIQGVAPLLMHNIAAMDPSHPFTKEVAKIAKKRPKTEADLEELSRLEFLGALYTDGDKIVVPAKLLHASIINGAKKNKQGPLAKAGIFLSKASFPLEFKGPKTIEKLWLDKKFVHKEYVRVGNAKVLRTRPIFNEWSLKFELEFLDDICDQDNVVNYIACAGRFCGIGDWRPQHGRFKVVSSN